MNCIKRIHLIPHIEGTYPVVCNCDGSNISLHHIFFNCSHYVLERLPLIQILHENELNCNLKNILSDNDEIIDEVFKFLQKIDYLKDI